MSHLAPKSVLAGSPRVIYSRLKVNGNMAVAVTNQLLTHIKNSSALRRVIIIASAHRAVLIRRRGAGL